MNAFEAFEAFDLQFFTYLFQLIHSAGSCFPLLDPSGCLAHVFEVRLLIEPYSRPQFLQVYLSFSVPS